MGTSVERGRSDKENVSKDTGTGTEVKDAETGSEYEDAETGSESFGLQVNMKGTNEAFGETVEGAAFVGVRFEGAASVGERDS